MDEPKCVYGGVLFLGLVAKDFDDEAVRLAADELGAALKRRHAPATSERGVRRLAISREPNGSATGELTLDPYPSRRGDAGATQGLHSRVEADSIPNVLRELARRVDEQPRVTLTRAPR